MFLCKQKVQEVKEEIATSASVPVNMQRLIFRGKVLKDDSPLGDIPGILDGGSTVHMVQRASNAPEAGSGAAGGAARGASTGARAGVRGRATVRLICEFGCAACSILVVLRPFSSISYGPFLRRFLSGRES